MIHLKIIERKMSLYCNKNNNTGHCLLQSDKVRSPRTGQLIDKYGGQWWLLQRGRDKYNEEELEKLPVINIQPVLKTTVKQLDIHKFRPGTRAGCILYTKVRGYLMFGFGVDKTYQQLTSFSGGYGMKDQNVLTAALRELCEETMGLYCDIDSKQIENNLVLYDKYQVTIFLQTLPDIDDITNQFRGFKSRYRNKIEIDDIEWMTEDVVKLYIKQKLPGMYKRVRDFLEKAGDFYSLL